MEYSLIMLIDKIKCSINMLGVSDLINSMELTYKAKAFLSNELF
jgi:hypothetical protein